MDHYTIVIHTRMRRKIFLAGNVSDRAVQLIVENAPSGTYICGYRMFPNAAAISIYTTENTSPEKLCYVFRKATSSKLRKEFPELRKMPSIWTRKFNIVYKEAQDIQEEEIIKLSP